MISKEIKKEGYSIYHNFKIKLFRIKNDQIF
jgi:hypothetical protein